MNIRQSLQNFTDRSFDVKINQIDITKYRNKNLRSLGPHVWN